MSAEHHTWPRPRPRPRTWLPSRRRFTLPALAFALTIAALVATAPKLWALKVLMAPRPPTEPLTTVPYVTPIWTGRSFAYLLMPLHGSAQEQGITLIDTGSDPKATAILAALANHGCTARCVQTVLMTHGHSDHTAGLDVFVHAEVMASAEDGALLRGDVGPEAPLMRLAMRMAPRQRHALRTVHLLAGQRLALGGHTVRVFGLPGHTPGSLGYAVVGGMFSGNAIDAVSLNLSSLRAYPSAYADYPAHLETILARVPARELAWLGDGTHGIRLRTRPLSE